MDFTDIHIEQTFLKLDEARFFPSLKTEPEVILPPNKKKKEREFRSTLARRKRSEGKFASERKRIALAREAKRLQDVKPRVAAELREKIKQSPGRSKRDRAGHLH